MDEAKLIDQLDEIVVNIKDSMNNLAEALNGSNVASEVQEQFYTYLARLNDYYSTQKSFKLLKDRANHIQIYANSISQKLKNSDLIKDQKIINELSKIQSQIENFKNLTEKREVPFVFDKKNNDIHHINNLSTDNLEKIELENLEKLRKPIDELKISLQLAEERHLKKEVSITEKLEVFEGQLSRLESSVKEKIDTIDNLYSETSEKLIEKQRNVDDLIGKISGRAIADGYDKNAENEKFSADWLRRLSLTCMFVIAVIIITTLYESEKFSLEQAILRLIFSIFLSVPAAYLARESTKHRKQQYIYLQTSLDLKAIDPYIASLPETEQHKLKTEIANRLFVSRDMSDISKDSYPINTHELLMKLIDKLEIKSK